MPAVSLLALTAPPRSQSELLFRELVRTRQTLFISPTLPPAEVRTWIAYGAGTEGDVTIPRQEPLAIPQEQTSIGSRLIAESFVGIDRMNALKAAAREEYLAVLDGLANLLRETDSAGVLHCSTGPQNPPRRGLTLDRVAQV